MRLADRVRALEEILKPKIIPWGRTYDALVEIDRRTSGAAEQGISFQEFLKEYEKTNETKAEFIVEKSLQYEKQHGGFKKL